MSFEAKIISAAGFRIIRDLAQGLENTGRSGEWGISVDSIYNAIPAEYTVNAVLINEDGETIGRASGSFSPKRNNYDSNNSYFSYNFSHADTTVTFKNVDANKITDTLTVSITGVNGVGTKTAGERGYIGVSTEDFADLEKQFKIGWWFGDAEIDDYKGASKTVVIPEKIGRWTLISIDTGAFSGNNLTSVVIPNGVTHIGGEAFSGNNLTSVVIPNGITFIGQWAFSGNNLTNVVIPNSVTHIGEGAFSDNRLTNVVIPNSVTFIGERAFFDNRLTSVTLPANLELVSALPFTESYNANGKKAGTYTRPSAGSSNWTYRP
ncbi:MAG: leucine-rich repeat domain-containing protein [Treponema sp.]|nr:leucine-rich repeat domain-containing protein [Treponema sp.]